MNDITSPLRLAVGSHQAGSGKGCAMNVISWESGDATITDLPGCADPFLARIVQRVNDRQCTHRDGDLLCSQCSLKVLELGHRTVGTNLAALGWEPERIRRVWVTIALEEAVSVARKDEDKRVARAREVTQAWLDGQATREQVRQAAAAAYTAAYTAAAYTAAAYAAAYAAAAAADAAADAADAAAADAAAAYAAARLSRAHRIVTRFEELTGITAPEPSPEATSRAYAAMTAVTR